MKRKNDLLLILGILLVSCCLLFFVGAGAKDGARVVVTQDGTVLGSYPLDEDREQTVGKEGQNKLAIHQGAVSITEADCPDQLCVKQGDISKEGQTIVCLPHKLVISIEGGKDSEFDGGNG